MCPRCQGNGPNGVKLLVDHLRSNNVKFGMVWLDIEQCTKCWDTDVASNCAWVGSLVDEYERLGVKVGIYSSPGEWPMTVGGGCTRFTGKPLWYAHYDGEPSFSDYSGMRFGGWSAPYMKQFADHADNSCGVSIDRDWRPR